MADYSKTSVATKKPVDKTIYELSGQFTYTYTVSDNGGSYTVPNPEPGVIFLPDSIFSIDGGDTWFGDLEAGTGNTASVPDINTCATVQNIIYRWGAFGLSGSRTVLFRTKLLAADI